MGLVGLLWLCGCVGMSGAFQSALGQPVELGMQAIDLGAPLSPEAIRFLHGDRRGPLWIGTTQGIYRYDGFDLVTIPALHQVAAGLEAEVRPEITLMTEGRSRQLWIGTGDGVYGYDPEKERLRVLGRGDPLLGSASRLCEDPGGRLWVIAGSGLHRVDPSEDVLKTYQLLVEDVQYLNLGGQLSCSIGVDGTFWMSGTRGLYRAVDDSMEHMVPTTHSGRIPPASVAAGDVLPLHIDVQGQVWSSTQGEVLRWNPHEETLAVFADRPAEVLYEDRGGRMWAGFAGGAECLTASAGVTPCPGSMPAPREVVVAMEDGPQGLMWIGTRSAVHLIEPSTGRVHGYAALPDGPDEGRRRSPAYFGDARGHLWILGLDSLYSVSKQLFEPVGSAMPPYGGAPWTRTLLVDGRGTLWAGMIGGVGWWDARSGSFREVALDGGPHQRVRVLYEDRQGVLWVGTDRDLLRMDPFRRRAERFLDPTDSPEHGWGITAILQDGQDTLWIGTYHGLYRLEAGRGAMRRQVLALPSGVRPAASVWSLLGAGGGEIWVGTGAGLCRLDVRSGACTAWSLADRAVLVLYRDRQDQLWAGTDQGLLRWNKGREVFEPFALHLPGDQPLRILSLFEDTETRFWLGTNRGLFSLDRISGQVLKYSMGEGGLGETILALAQGPRQQLWAAIHKGGLVRMRAGPGPDPLPLLRLDVSPPGRSPGQAPASRAGPSRTDVRASYAVHALEGSPSAPVAYQLDGFSKDWQYGAARQDVFYPRVPPGRYHFRVRAADRMGRWRESSVEVRVPRPWWMQWWFVAAVVVGILAAVTGGRHVLRKMDRRVLVPGPRAIRVPAAEERFWTEATRIVEAHMADETFGARELAEALALSPRQLRSRFQPFGITPTRFIRNIRLERAASLLEQRYGTIAEVADAVGFKHVTYFTRCFRQAYGVPPSAYRTQHRG